MQLALGLIETKGLVGAIEAADAMAKAADIHIVSKEKITAALITIKITGEVAAVRSALDAGAAAAQRIGQLVAVHIIPRPDDQLDPIIFDHPIENKTEDQKPEPFKQKTPAVKPLKASALVIKETESAPLLKEHAPAETKEIPEIDLNEIETMSVNKLRRMARNMQNFPIKGRIISSANRQTLIEYFKSIK